MMNDVYRLLIIVGILAVQYFFQPEATFIGVQLYP